MPTDLKIRKAVKEDAVAVDLLIRQLAAFEGVISQIGFSVDALEHALAGQSPKLHAVVAEGPAGLLGFVTYTVDFTIWSGSDTIRVDDLFVVTDARGLGIGRRLMAEVARVAISRGATARWEVESANLAAQRFYEGLGVALRQKVVARWSHQAMAEWLASDNAGHARSA